MSIIISISSSMIRRFPSVRCGKGFFISWFTSVCPPRTAQQQAESFVQKIPIKLGYFQNLRIFPLKNMCIVFDLGKNRPTETKSAFFGKRPFPKNMKKERIYDEQFQ